MVDPVKIETGYQHCAVFLQCAGCPYQELEESTTCIVKLMGDMRERIKDLEAAKAGRQWINAEDEKPPYNTYVKVWTNDGRELIAVYTYSKEWVTEYFLEITHSVTHWAELDEAPKEETENAEA